MEAVGIMTDVRASVFDGKLNVSLKLDTDSLEDLADVHANDLLDVKIEKHIIRRSLDANKLLWMCIGKIAKALKVDKWSVYLSLLRDYGQFVYISVMEEAVEAVKRQWREVEVVGYELVPSGKIVQLCCYFGSHTYNRAEFATLLEGVKQEMLAAGLEPPASADMRRSLEAWERKCAQS